MIISRTPLRMSFAGGGSDIASYYRQFGGAVVSTAIDKYIYVLLKRHSNLYNEKFRLNYSTTEICNSVSEINLSLFLSAISAKAI